MDIRQDDLQSPEIKKLLSMHLENTAQHSPPESVHALDIETLAAPNITFWSVWEDDELLGCGALKEIASQHGEIKSMHTSENHRGKGVASRIVEHLMEEARQRGYQSLSLETGSMAAYAPARALYAKFGFAECGPFANYEIDPHSTYMRFEF